MIAAHEVSAARKPIGGKAAINFETFEKTSIHSSIDLTYLFLDIGYYGYINGYINRRIL